MQVPEQVRSVFIDVGGHLGKTLEETFRLPWSFDRIFCFEPQLHRVEKLRNKFIRERIEIVSEALSGSAGESTLFDSPGGALFYAEKRDIDPSQRQVIATK